MEREPDNAFIEQIPLSNLQDLQTTEIGEFPWICINGICRDTNEDI